MNRSITLATMARGFSSTSYLTALAVSSVLFAGCASAPKPPIESLQAAELAIATAEQNKVADYASPELGEARDKLVEARTAVAKEEMLKAQRLAEKARVDAELANAKAEAAKAKSVNEELNKSIDTLKEEMQRNPGVQP